MFAESAQKTVELEVEGGGDIYIPDLSFSSYQDIAAEDEEEDQQPQQHSFEDWGHLLQSKVRENSSYCNTVSHWQVTGDRPNPDLYMEYGFGSVKADR